MTTAQDGGKVVSPGRIYPTGNVAGTHFSQRLSRPQGHSAIGSILCQAKIQMKPAGIEPATFRFVAQHVHQCATAVPTGQQQTGKTHRKTGHTLDSSG
jgi:hypothetical protein